MGTSFALFIPFFKGCAILPALTAIALGSLGKMPNYPHWRERKPSNRARANAPLTYNLLFSALFSCLICNTERLTQPPYWSGTL